ncbi:hypothetical protein V9W64_10710 [Neisseria leonii]|uniref:Uncharacterized protein n=1 Tax=Neisseria leonii TaxID=2995413 RepID=A0A9X4E406_9NEIS|nr:hypothetical protein [Neisseria sp. 51.81]MDD9328799.1 hypothetical protein [Neisseria sp. 51.81]
MKIINLTQHAALPEQGCIEPEMKEAVKGFLTFGSLPAPNEILWRAEMLAQTAAEEGAEAAMIGGAPYLMSALENALKSRGIKPLYAFSERVSAETVQPDGTVLKTNVFRHVGFVEV